MAEKKSIWTLFFRDKASRGLKRLNQNTNQVNRSIERFEKGARRSAAATAALRTGALAAAAAIGILLKKMFDFGQQLEGQGVRLNQVLRDQIAARQTLEEAIEFANVTPFKTSKVVDTVLAIVQARGAFDDYSKSILTAIGNAAAFTGRTDGLVTVTEVWRKAINRGRVDQEQYNRLLERNINLNKQFSQILGIATEDVAEAGVKGKITGEVLTQALLMASESGGLFEGAMEKLSKTLTGRASTAAGKFEDLIAKMGLSFQKAFSLGLEGSISLLDELLKNGGLFDVMKEFEETTLSIAKNWAMIFSTFTGGGSVLGNIFMFWARALQFAATNMTILVQGMATVLAFANRNPVAGLEGLANIKKMALSHGDLFKPFAEGTTPMDFLNFQSRGGDGGNGITPDPAASLGGEDLNDQLTRVSGGGVRNVTVNLDSLINGLTINSENIQETMEDVRKMVIETMVRAVKGGEQVLSN